MLWWSMFEALRNMSRVDAIEEKSEQRLEGKELGAIWISEIGALRAKKTASVKALRQESVWHV